MTRRRIAIGLGTGLMALAALVGWAAAWLEDLPPSQTIDPHHSGVAIAGGIAALFCIYALWHLSDVARGRAGWVGAGFGLALALLALLAVDAVAFASRLGG